MREPPATSFLLALAAEAEEEDAALAGRCRDIARRESLLSEGRYDAIRRALAALYGSGEDDALLARLAADIRAGRFDPPAIEQLLHQLIRLRLEENNPLFITNN